MSHNFCKTMRLWESEWQRSIAFYGLHKCSHSSSVAILIYLRTNLEENDPPCHVMRKFNGSGELDGQFVFKLSEGQHFTAPSSWITPSGVICLGISAALLQGLHQTGPFLLSCSYTLRHYAPVSDFRSGAPCQAGCCYRGSPAGGGRESGGMRLSQDRVSGEKFFA